MAEVTKSGEVANLYNPVDRLSVKRERIEIDKKRQQPDEYRDHADENSPPDYELSLREENIRLKSRLEQAKEKALNLERYVAKYEDELQKEKIFTEKANNTIYNLMNDKSTLEEKLKRQPKSNKRLEDIIRKLEQEVYALEERLDRQRKRYHHEHLLIYDDLKGERRKQFEWKQTYLRSQVSVMAFRRKLQLLKVHLRPEDHAELMGCLTIDLHDCDSETESVKEKHRPRTCYVTDRDRDRDHDRNAYKYDRSHHQGYIEQYQPYHDSKPRDRHHLSCDNRSMKNDDRIEELKENRHAVEAAEFQPKVFIVEEQNRFGSSPKTYSSVSSVPSPHDLFYQRGQVSSPSPSLFNGHAVRSGVDKNTNEERLTSLHENWHHHSLDGSIHHNTPPNRNDVVIETRVSPTPERSGHERESQFEKEDYKFLELKFDNGQLKTDSRQQSLLFQQNPSHTSETTSRPSCRSVPVGTPLEKKKIWCLTCDGEVTDKLCGHSNLVIQEREKEFPCPTCGRIFNNRSHLKRHNMIHSGEKPWACSYCEKRFNRKSHLSRHTLTHTGERPFKCPYCGKGFADNSDLKRHKQIHESTPGFVPIFPKNLTPSSLPSVPKITIVASENNLTSSNLPSIAAPVVADKKKPEAKFPCNKCGKIFTRKSHLTRHKLTHDQIKIYCDCGRMFRQNAHLQAHLPACRRKRDVIEAKYLASHSRKQEMVEEPRSPSNSSSHGNIEDMDYELHHGQTYQNINTREGYQALNNVPPGMIRDPS